mgnify:CR=1 FL=1|jgi:hypothetical protein
MVEIILMELLHLLQGDRVEVEQLLEVQRAVLQVHMEILELVVLILLPFIIVVVEEEVLDLQGVLIMVVQDYLLLVGILVFHQLMVHRDQVQEDILLVVEQELMEQVVLDILDLVVTAAVEVHLVQEPLILEAEELEVYKEESMAVVMVVQEL